MSLLSPAVSAQGRNLWQRLSPTVRYLLETEVHVYAFSMAANVLLSFYPFLLVMISFTRSVLHWKEAEQAIFFALDDFYPGSLGAFIARNVKFTAMMRGPLQATSLFLLLLTANGIFEPLEVALNRAWGIHKNRSYFRNQLVSLGLILLCGGLALASMLLTALNQELWKQLNWGGARVSMVVNLALFKAAAVPITMVALFVVYWVLPNGRVNWRAILPVAGVVGLILEVFKYLNLLMWPYWRDKLRGEYGPFDYAVMIVLWGFISSMVVLAGAHLAAQRARELELQSQGEADTVKVEIP